MIVMNERKFVEELIAEKPNLTRRYSKDRIMKMLCQYYNNDGIYYDKIVEHMNELFPDDFHIEHYGFTLCSMLSTGKEKNLQLKEVNEINIYENEMSVLKNLDNNTLKKLFFTCIVIARLKDNDGWLGVYDPKDIVEIFKLANISAQEATKEQRFKLLGQLERQGLLIGAKRIDSLNERVVLEPEGDVCMTITSLDYLGNQYLVTEKEGRILCGGCGRIMKKTSNKKQYCKKCAEKNIEESKRKYEEYRRKTS